MGDTTNYDIPYPEPTDAPDGASQMKAIAETVDAALHAHAVQGGVVDTVMAAWHHTLDENPGVDPHKAARGNHGHPTEFAKLDAYSAMGTWAGSDASDINIPPGTVQQPVTVSAGGLVFTAPPSGKVLIHIAAEFGAYDSGTFVGWRLMKGGTIGSNSGSFAIRNSPTMSLVGFNGITATGPQTAGTAHTHPLSSQLTTIRMAGLPWPETGLVPGDQYNVQYLFWNNDATGTVVCYNRGIVVQSIH